MAEASHTVRRKQSQRIIDILELVEGYINNHNTLGERHWTHNTISKSLKLFFRIQSLMRKVVYTHQQVSMRIIDDNNESILVKSFTR